jgi:hypothetical protein
MSDTQNMRALMEAVNIASKPSNEAFRGEEPDDDEEEQYDFHDGQKVKLSGRYKDEGDETYTLSDWDGSRGWIGDRDNRGWNVMGHQIEAAPEGEEYDDDHNHDPQDDYEW